jgi:4-hydroxybenzoate polyprenyltransferase
VQREFAAPPRAPALLRALRMHQWAKNLLVFLPLLTAHRWNDAAAALHSLELFAAFCLCASAIYLVNDMLDIEADRGHPRKRQRPIASGELTIPTAMLAAIVLMAGGLAIAARISISVVSLLALYVAGTSAYSLGLKSRALVDVIGLAMLYTVRIIAGAWAIDVVLSFWLLAFSMFLFLSLSTLKRCAELRNLPQLADASGRGYVAGDLPYLAGFGTAAGMGAVVILALFVNSPETAARYRRPEYLWLLCPILIYWIGRLWLLTGRGQMHDDPLVFAVRDKATAAALVVAVGLVVAAL